MLSHHSSYASTVCCGADPVVVARIRRNGLLSFVGGVDFHLAGLALLRDRDGQRQHAVVTYRAQLVRIEVVAEKQLAPKLALGPLIDDQLIALLAQRTAARGDLDDVALDCDIDVIGLHARDVEGDNELVTTSQRLHGQRARSACAGQCLLGQPVKFAKRIESHQSHGFS